MENSSRIVVTFDPESVFDQDNEKTITTSRKYFNTGTLQSAQAVVPLTPGPAMVIPLRSGVSARWLAFVAGFALVCGTLGGWIIGRSRQSTNAEQDFSSTSPARETPAAETPQPAPLPEVAPAIDNSTPPVLPETSEATAWMTQNDKNGRKKPVMRPAKVAPKTNATPAETPSPAATPGGNGQAAPNGESRPRRIRADSNERATGLMAHEHTERTPRTGRERNH